MNILNELLDILERKKFLAKRSMRRLIPLPGLGGKYEATISRWFTKQHVLSSL